MVRKISNRLWCFRGVYLPTLDGLLGERPCRPSIAKCKSYCNMILFYHKTPFGCISLRVVPIMLLANQSPYDRSWMLQAWDPLTAWAWWMIGRSNILDHHFFFRHPAKMGLVSSVYIASFLVQTATTSNLEAHYVTWICDVKAYICDNGDKQRFYSFIWFH